MPEDLLLELEPPAATSLEEIAEFIILRQQDIVRAVVEMKGSARLFENAWERLIVEVARGQTAEIHAARPRLLSAFEKRLTRLKFYYALVTLLQQFERTEAPDPEILLAEISAMSRLKTSVFDRWQTADDLEELAARDFPLTTAELDRIGPQRRPPASSYKEESKPF